MANKILEKKEKDIDDYLIILGTKQGWIKLIKIKTE